MHQHYRIQISGVVVLNKAAMPTLTGALHPDTCSWTVHPLFLIPGVLLHSTPMGSHLDCHCWLFSPTRFLAEQMFCTCQKASMAAVSHRFAMWTEIQNWTLETCWVLVGSWQKIELSHLTLPKVSDAPKKVCFSFYKSAEKKMISMAYFTFSVFLDEKWTKLGIFNCLIHYCSLRN